MGTRFSVEIAIEARLLASTRVGLTGDMDTAWDARVLSGLLALHHRSVDLTLETRAGLLRVAILVVQGAGLLAPVLAAWRFLHQVPAEARRMASTRTVKELDR